MKLFTLPNLLTLGNLFCGSLACLFVIYGVPAYIILILICASLLFDLLDGMVARAMKINSEIGIQLDSLADMVSFGLLPGILMTNLLGGLHYIKEYIIELTQNILSDKTETIFTSNPPNFFWIPILGLLIPLFSALRLAKFNIDTEQSTYFKGLNTPANTILILSLCMINYSKSFIIDPKLDIYLLIGITLISCWLLISNIPIFSFKFKGFAWKDNHYKYIFLIISIILLAFFQIYAIPFIIILYILISIIFRKKITYET